VECRHRLFFLYRRSTVWVKEVYVWEIMNYVGFPQTDKFVVDSKSYIGYYKTLFYVNSDMNTLPY
jgi:hypothetical protein